VCVVITRHTGSLWNGYAAFEVDSRRLFTKQLLVPQRQHLRNIPLVPQTRAKICFNGLFHKRTLEQQSLDCGKCVLSRPLKSHLKSRKITGWIEASY